MQTIQNPLTFSDLKHYGSWDRAGRWYPSEDIAEYFNHIRSPSRAWPYSYAKAACTVKFMKWYNSRIVEVA